VTWGDTLPSFRDLKRAHRPAVSQYPAQSRYVSSRIPAWDGPEPARRNRA